MNLKGLKFCLVAGLGKGLEGLDFGGVWFYTS